MDTRLRYDVGTTIGGYRVDRVEWLENLKGTYYELTHQPTGARHMHIDAPDESKAFCVAFPTVPKDGRGVAHILEHVVLAGSERFPVRDPFFSMTSRSVKDFMNAMTFADATAYPFSSRNARDFDNLLEVYLDACFFPKIEESSFKQEGHRLEFEKTDDPTSGLRIKGVVFNEMKGAMASSNAVMGRSIGKALMPGSTYANNSGGDPAAIPDLTWQDLRDFHATHYHPSNALFYTYGDMPLADLLAKIEDLALSRFEKITVDVSIPDQPRFNEPQTFTDVYPLSRDEDPARKTEILIGWLTTSQTDPFESLALHVLSEILLGNAGSPLHKALVDSGLGDALATGSGYSPSFKEAVLGAGLKGTDPDKADEIERVVLDTLKRLADEGIDRELVDAAIHQFELHTREVTNTGFPYSLKLFFYTKAAYMYGGDPYRALQLDADFERLHAEVSAGPFFENLIRRYLLDNPHRARIVIGPDQELEERQVAAELERVGAIESSLTEEQRQAIVAETVALKARQEADQDLSSLPTLELSDIPLDTEDVALDVETIGGATVAFCDQPTNGLSYVTIHADTSGLEDRLKDRLSLFARSLSRTGAGEFDYVRQALRIDAYTGGISANPSTRLPLDGSEPFQELVVSGKALVRNHKPFAEIMRDILSAPTFEPQRMRDIVAEARAQSESMVVFVGQQYAAMLAASKLYPTGALNERMHGLTALATLKSLAALGDDLGEVIADLEQIREHVFRAGNLRICVTAEDRSLPELRELITEVIGALPPDSTAGGPLPALGDRRFEAKTTSVPVTYNAKVVETVRYSHPDAPVLMVLGNYMKNVYLHREIRERGGAYGSHSSLNPDSGVFTFWSYRDPNVVRTFQAFDGAVEHVVTGDLDPTDVKEAVIQSLGQVDPLLSPDTKGRKRFFDDVAGYTPEVQARFKQGLLAVTPDDLRRVAATYLRSDAAVLASVGNAQKIEEANAELGDVFEVSAI